MREKSFLPGHVSSRRQSSLAQPLYEHSTSICSLWSDCCLDLPVPCRPPLGALCFQGRSVPSLKPVTEVGCREETVRKTCVNYWFWWHQLSWVVELFRRLGRTIYCFIITDFSYRTFVYSWLMKYSCNIIPRKNTPSFIPIKSFLKTIWSSRCQLFNWKSKTSISVEYQWIP